MFSLKEYGISFIESKFESLNLFAFLNYNLTEKTKLQIEVTYLNYLAQQAGGLTDEMFIDNPLQSNRSRNWFKVNWFLHSTKLLSLLPAS